VSFSGAPVISPEHVLDRVGLEAALGEQESRARLLGLELAQASDLRDL
jgi:hypothetical protein